MLAITLLPDSNEKLVFRLLGTKFETFPTQAVHVGLSLGELGMGKTASLVITVFDSDALARTVLKGGHVKLQVLETSVATGFIRTLHRTVQTAQIGTDLAQIFFLTLGT